MTLLFKIRAVAEAPVNKNDRHLCVVGGFLVDLGITDVDRLRSV